MSLGKLDPAELGASVLPYNGYKDPDVCLWPRLGGDGGIVRSGDQLFSLSSDPITGTSRSMGKLAVVVNSNDIASLGGEPRWMLLTLLIPEDGSGDLIEEIMESVHNEAKRQKIAVVGGHTERVENLSHPIICGSMIGINARFLDPSLVEEGDKLIIIGTAGLEGTAILADTFEDKLKESGVSKETIEEAIGLFDDLSIISQARKTRENALLMHDPTEGGVIGAIGELSRLIGKKIEVREEDIPVADVTKKICKPLEVDPLRLISSGALLALVREQELETLL